MTEPATSFPPGVRTYQGSCRCGAIRFEADIDLSQGTTQCNCTFCAKAGWWSCRVSPKNFRLISGEDRELTGPYDGIRPCCPTCHICPFGHWDIPEIGGEGYGVNVRCLDDVDLSGVPIYYLDGRHDTWALLSQGAYEDPFVGAGDRSKPMSTVAAVRDG